MMKLNHHKAILLILAVSAAVYVTSLSNDFAWDDWMLMVNNPAYLTFDLKSIFLSKANGLEYLPVRDLTLAIDAGLWGMQPFGFHFTNLLIYLAGLVVVFDAVKILARLAGEENEEFMAFWTTLLFALHPLHVEPVNYVAARNNLLASLLLFLSFNVCMKGIQRKKVVPIIVSSIIFAASLFSKASVIFYPLFLMVVFLYVPGSTLSLRGKALILSAFLVIDAAAVFVHFRNASQTGMMNENLIRFGIGSNAVLIARAVGIAFFYLEKLFLPYPLTILYSASFLPGGLDLVTIAEIIMLAIGFFLTVIWRKRYPIVVFAVAWYFLSLGPVLNIFPTEPVVADRYAFFAVLGFGLLLAYLLKILIEKKRHFVYVACGIIVIWAFMDISRSQAWNDDLSLWKSALSTDPKMTRVELATALWKKGRYEEALTYLKDEYEKDHTYRYNQFMGRYLFQSGRYEDAVPFFRKALEESGGNSKEVNIELASAYERTGNRYQALEHYLKAMHIKEASPMSGTDQSAMEGAERVRNYFMPELNELKAKAASQPGDFKAQAEFALFLHKVGMYQEARNYYLKSIELDSSRWEAWYNLGLTYSELGRYVEAIDAFEKSLRLNYRNKNALNKIGICYGVMRNYEQAIRYYKEALDLDPGFLSAIFNLGRIYFAEGDGVNAKIYLSRARTLANENRDFQSIIDHYLEQIK